MPRRARRIVRDARPMIQSFICPVSQEDCMLDVPTPRPDNPDYNGIEDWQACDCFNSKFLHMAKGIGGYSMGVFQCLCGKKLTTKVLSKGKLVT